MADLLLNSIVTSTQGVYDYTLVGTVAGTTTVSSEPTFLHSLTVTTRGASGALTLYDSAGTSGTIIGTLNMGTQTFSDPPASYVFDIRTRNGLTVVNTTNVGCIISAHK